MNFSLGGLFCSRPSTSRGKMYIRSRMFHSRSYESLNDDNEPASPPTVHVVPDREKNRWTHITYLDSFFTRVYRYHQNHGLGCMMVNEILELVKFFFVMGFSTLLFYGVNYDILFKKKSSSEDVALTDAILTPDEILKRVSLISSTAIALASAFLTLRVFKVFYNFFQYFYIKFFYNYGLDIKDNELDNLTWHEVLQKVLEFQKQVDICIQKRELTELDVYQRILRFKNYMVAMINKSIIPVHLTYPLVGEVIFLTSYLKYNLEFLLFWGPWSPFDRNHQLLDSYKRSPNRSELSNSLSRGILIVGIVNLVLSPLIFIWQILYFFFNYGESVKREPGLLANRSWSLHGRLYMRHFNELDHELDSRLKRAHHPASRYMKMFTSPLLSVIAENVQFVAGSICVVFVTLTLLDEDVLMVKPVLPIIAVTGCIAAMCSKLIPDQNLIWCPESYLTAVLAHAHYCPDSWRNQAPTLKTKAEFSQLFQYKTVLVLQELMSPLITPYMLIFHLRPRSQRIVDFYCDHSVEVEGVGDVCSFAQMDVMKHGHPMWSGEFVESSAPKDCWAENGKTELSLIHFTLTNPNWKPPHDAETFLNSLHENAKQEASTLGCAANNSLYAILSNLSSFGHEYNDVVSYLIKSPVKSPETSEQSDRENTTTRVMHSRNVTKVEGPVQVSADKSLICGIVESYRVGVPSPRSTKPIEFKAVDMSLAALYLHELHHRALELREVKKRILADVRAATERKEQETPC